MLQVDTNIYAEAEVMTTIQGVSTFDSEWLDYYNFLECIARVIKARPYSEEEEKELTDFSTKVAAVCTSLENAYEEECTQMFEQQRQIFEEERRYQPRIVVDDEEDGVSDDDD